MVRKMISLSSEGDKQPSCIDGQIQSNELSQPCGLFLNQQELATLKHASDLKIIHMTCF